jgi:hypothetical protein
MSKLIEIVRQVRWSVGQRGVLGTLRVAGERLVRKDDGTGGVVHPFDVRHGLDTSGFIGGGRLGGSHARARFSTAYYGVQPSRLKGALEKWSETSGTRAVGDVTFVDAGAGKGRAMMVASEMGFAAVVGVELDADVAAVGQRNLELWRAACPMRLVQGDAAEMEFPVGPLLIFLYNPFQAPVLRRLLERVCEERERDVDVLYMVSVERAVFGEFPRLRPMWRAQIEMSEEDSAVDAVSAAGDECDLYRLMERAGKM